MKKRSNEWPYDCPPDEALENLLLAAGRVGVITSGLVLSSAADSYTRNLRLWNGVVLSMLEVSRIIYIGNNRWYVTIHGINEDYDDGERFTPNGGPPRFLYAEDWSLVKS